jgi:hypothetical protein
MMTGLFGGEGAVSQGLTAFRSMLRRRESLLHFAEPGVKLGIPGAYGRGNPAEERRMTPHVLRRSGIGFWGSASRPRIRTVVNSGLGVVSLELAFGVASEVAW